jgi:hypothetical protein
MIKHIVFFKLLNSSADETRKVQLKKMDAIFSPLGNKLPFIVEYKVGINFNKSPYAWDFAIDSVFKNKEDLQKYLDSEEHTEAVRKGSEIEKTKAVIDYEF